VASLPEGADILIIGAGVVGCSLAFHLANQGAERVVMLDRGQIGQGSTAANAGGVRAQFSTEVNIRLGIEAKRMLANFEAETGQSADFRLIGYLFLLSTPEELAMFKENVRLQRRCGLDDVR
jgi:sarcosine oxidase subunit beta